MMKKFLLLSALFALAALSQAGELLSPEQWKHECRPERKLSTVKIAGDGTVRFRRFAGAEFARLYQDVELERGAYYSLTYAQRTEHGALDKLLVIFRGADGKWREKSRLTDVTPLVNGEWTAGKLVFQVPPDVNLARIDFRLDSAGTVELKDIMLEKLDPADGKAYLDSLRPAPFQPGRNSGDLAVKSDSYQVIAFAVQGGENGGKVTVEFHDPERGWINRSLLTFFVPAGTKKEFREVTLIPENVNGLRFTAAGCEIDGLKLAELEIK